MKKYSNTRMFIEYILIVFCSYLLISFIISFIGGYGYRYILTHWGQLYGIIFLYWWIPFPRMIDMDDENN
jgi:hypothetical protein